MRRGILASVLFILICAALSPSASAFPLDWSFSVLPVPDIFGPAGTTVGFGYQITNLDEQNWLVTSSVDAGSFQHATPSLIFDFPILAPLQSVFLPYDPISHSGLYEITWDADASLGFMNSGVFTVTSDFYDGDPFNGGQLLFPGVTRDAAYSITAGGELAVPEPSTFLVFLGGLLVSSCLRFHVLLLAIRKNLHREILIIRI